MPKREIKLLSEKKMEEVKHNIAAGFSQRKSCEMAKVNESTFRSVKRRGRLAKQFGSKRRLMSNTEEERVVRYINKWHTRGFPISRRRIRKIVASYVTVKAKDDRCRNLMSKHWMTDLNDFKI